MLQTEDFFNSERAKIDIALRRELSALSGTIQNVGKYILALPGKRLRPLLCICTAGLFGQKGAEVYPLAAALEILHSATLLHDDILDEADLRRAAPAAHLKFGKKAAILAGDALLALSGEIVARYSIPRLVTIISQAIMRTARGQIEESENLYTLDTDWERYLNMISGKTASLIAASCRLGAVFAGASPQDEEIAGKFGLNLGIAFQLTDDILDFSPSEETGKTQGGDLREGKLTAPVLLYLAGLESGEKEKFLSALAKKSFDSINILELFYRSAMQNAINQTRDLATNYSDKAIAYLKKLPFSEHRDILVASAENLKNRNL